ncbi:MAG TPA: hypothetical protein VF310_10255 [Vicinamibacteria bacterium]
MRLRIAFGPGLALALAVPGAAAAGEHAEAVRRAQALVQRVEEASQREFAPAWRALLVSRLAILPEEQLSAREGRGPAPLALGDSSAQLVYTPVTPCRIADTRVAGGMLAPGVARDLRVTGTGSLAGQGGSSSGCNVPFGPATAAVINFVAVNPSGGGNLRAWAYATPPPDPPAASILNYTTVPGAVLNLANGIVVPLCDSDVTTCPNLDLRVRADAAATHLVADVVGYFERFPKSQVRVFSEIDNQTSATTIDNSCTHVTGADVTVVAPGPGRVIVRASVPHRIQQNFGGDRVLLLGIATQNNDCNFTNFSHSKVKNDNFMEDFLATIPVVGTFTVSSAGTYNYYLNGRMPNGGGNAVVVPGTLIEATFYPN